MAVPSLVHTPLHGPVLVADRYYPNKSFDAPDDSSFRIWDERVRYDLLAGLTSGHSAQEISRGTLPVGRVTRTVKTTELGTAAVPNKTFVDRLYNRIHFIPDRIEAGNLIARQTYDFIIWNAYLSPQDLNLIQEFDTVGIVYVFPGGEVVPFEIRALQMIDMQVELTMAGPPIIDAVLRFIFENDVVDLPIIGTRMLTWPIRPDGGQAFGEKFKWLTDIITAESGREQRIALRETPEHSIEATYTAIREDANVMDSLLWGWQNRLFAYPLWQLPVKLTAPVVMGNTVIPVTSTQYKRFIAGGLGVIYNSAKKYEAFEIDTVDANSITLKRALRAGWPQGCEVLPLRTARAENAIKQQWPVNQMVTAQIRFVMEDDPEFTPTELGPLYQGYYIMPLRPNWTESLEESVERNFDSIENEIGRRDYSYHSEVPSVTRGFLWFLQNVVNIDAFIKWHYARRGSQVPFWVPSWKDDLTLAAPIAVGDNYIRVVNNDTANLYTFNSGRDHLYIVTKTKCAPYTRKILSIGTDELDPTKAIITLDQVMPNAHGISEIETISFMGLHRMSADEVTIEWLSDQVASVNTNMKMLSDAT